MKKWKVGVVFLLLTVVCSMPMAAHAATLAQREACKQTILEMLYTADTERQNILQYRITKDEFNELFEEVRHGDGAEIYGAYFPSTKISYVYRTSSGYVETIWLTGANEDALQRYEEMVPVIDSIVAGIEADMSDLDKLIYLHNAVVDRVTYKKTTDAMYIASGALVEKQAVCSGYAKALNVLLRRVGFETSYVSGTSLNHGWSYVKLDGEWYHVDPTWDDTRTPVWGEVSRTNLLRNDSEFGKNHGTWDVLVIDETAVSTKYENWLVHDIVGEMIFENGRWYHLDTKSKTVVAIDAVNNRKEVLFDYSSLGKVTLVDVEEERIILSVNGEEVGRTAEQWRSVVGGTEEEVPTEPDFIVEEEVQVLPNYGAAGNVSTPEYEVEDEVQITPDAGMTSSLDFSDISYWKTGHYDTTYGAYCLNRTRICLNDLIENTKDRYVVTVGHEDYKVVIIEYNTRKRIIGSVELGDGAVYVPSEGTVYLGVSVFNSVQSKGVSFETYESMFADGFVVGFNFGVVEEPEYEIEDVPSAGEQEEQGDGVAFTLNYSDISYWRTGHYDTTFGAYCLNRARICLYDLLEAMQGQYTVTIDHEDYKVVIIEYNARKRIIGSVELGNGEVYVPSEGTEYLGISVFNSVQSKGMLYETYEDLFANGFVIGFAVSVEE